jgi:hypothetical protein
MLGLKRSNFHIEIEIFLWIYNSTSKSTSLQPINAVDFMEMQSTLKFQLYNVYGLSKQSNDTKRKQTN